MRALGAGAAALVAHGAWVAPPAAVVDAQTAGSVSIIDGAAVPPPCGSNPYCFTPPTVTIDAGGAVTWTDHSADAPHTVTADSTSAEKWDSGTLNQGQTFSHTFHSPGTFTYHCNFHSFMKATVQVNGSAPGTTPSSSSSSPGHGSSSPTTHPGTTSSTTTTHSTSAASSTSAAPANGAAIAQGGGAGGGSMPSDSPGAHDSSGDSSTFTPDAGVTATAGGGGGGVAGWAIAVLLVTVLAGGGGVVGWLRRAR